MAVFAYKAVDLATGKRKSGELAAESAYQVRASLRRMGLQVQSVSDVKSRRKAKARSSGVATFRERFTRSRRRQRVIELYENLGTLLGSGNPLVPSIDTLAISAKKSRRDSQVGTMCRQLAESVRGGTSLADAMMEQPEWFGPVDIALVRSGQSSGHLEQSLGDLAEMHSSADTLASRLIGVMAYPAILFVIGIGVVIFLATVPVPQLAGALQDQGEELPAITEVLLTIGNTLRDQWYFFPPVIVAVAVVFHVLFRSRIAALWRLKVPLLGSLIAKTQLSSFCTILERLLVGGIPLTHAIELATPTLRNAALREVFEQVPRQLADGRNLSEPLRESKLFDPVFCRVMEIGADSGELPRMIGTIGQRYALISSRLIDRASTVIEPLVIVLLACMLGFVVLAAILPMLRLTQSL